MIALPGLLVLVRRLVILGTLTLALKNLWHDKVLFYHFVNRLLLALVVPHHLAIIPIRTPHPIVAEAHTIRLKVSHHPIRMVTLFL